MARQGLPSTAVSELINMGQLALSFGQINRTTYHADGVTPESDTDHTVMLALTAHAFASKYVRRLDLGKVLLYALVHDLPEVYAGDTPTLWPTPTDADRVAKAEREAAAILMLRDQFEWCYPSLPEAILRYEAQDDPEARYVKVFDKMMPKITHILNGLQTMVDAGMLYRDIAERYDAQFHEYHEYFEEFPEVRELRHDLLVTLCREAVGVMIDAPPRKEQIV